MQHYKRKKQNHHHHYLRSRQWRKRASLCLGPTHMGRGEMRIMTCLAKGNSNNSRHTLHFTTQHTHTMYTTHTSENCTKAIKILYSSMKPIKYAWDITKDKQNNTLKHVHCVLIVMTTPSYLSSGCLSSWAGINWDRSPLISVSALGCCCSFSLTCWNKL